MPSAETGTDKKFSIGSEVCGSIIRLFLAIVLHFPASPAEAIVKKIGTLLLLNRVIVSVNVPPLQTSMMPLFDVAEKSSVTALAWDVKKISAATINNINIAWFRFIFLILIPF